MIGLICGKVFPLSMICLILNFISDFNLRENASYHSIIF